MTNWKTCVDIYKDYKDPDADMTMAKLATKYEVSLHVVEAAIAYFNGALVKTKAVWETRPVSEPSRWHRILRTHVVGRRELDDIIAFGNYLDGHVDNVLLTLQKLVRIGVATKEEFEEADYNDIQRIQYFGNARLAAIRELKGVPEPVKKKRRSCPYCTNGKLPLTVAYEDEVLLAEDLHFCPVCGKKFKKEVKKDECVG